MTDIRSLLNNVDRFSSVCRFSPVVDDFNCLMATVELDSLGDFVDWGDYTNLLDAYENLIYAYEQLQMEREDDWETEREEDWEQDDWGDRD